MDLMRRVPPRLVEVAIAALGTLVVHELAYGLASIAPGGHRPLDHAHMSLLWAMAMPTAVVAAVAFIIHQVRNLGLVTLTSTGTTAGWVAGLFLIQESIEVAVAGHGVTELVSNPAVAVGLVLAPAVARVLTRFLTGAAELTARLFTTPRPLVVPTTLSVGQPDSVDLPSLSAFRPSSPRAPPVLI